MSVGSATYVTPQVGRVLITQLTRPPGTSEAGGSHVVSKIMIKSVVRRKSKTSSKLPKKDPKIFMLRSVDVGAITSCDKLKDLIRTQLKDDVVKEFDVGYYQGSTVISIRSAEDINEVWQELKKGSKVVLWCDGLRESDKSRKRKRVSSDSESDDCETEPAKKTPISQEKEKEEEDLVRKLKAKHDLRYTQMQYRMWAQMVMGGYHKHAWS